MKCCLSDLRYKEVIDLTTGQRLGYVCDAEIDLEEGKIVSLIVPGQKKLGGLLSGDDDYILPWESISRLGEDIILAEVAAQQPRRRREKRIMELRYLQGKTQMEVAQEIGISQAQVSRLEKNALDKIRRNIFPS